MKKRILIVEDEENIIDILAFNLQREGYETIEAMDGATGLEKALEHDPDLILLDLMLPRMDGFEVCRRLREQGRNVILDLDVYGAMKVRTLCPDATLVFLVPPTWDELEERIHKSKYIPESEIEGRLEIAKEEVLCAEQYDYILINDTVEDTVRRLAQIIHGNRYSRNSMKGFLKSYIESEISSELVDMIRAL